MKSFFKDLFGYNHHFNQKLGDAFNDNPDQVSDKAIKLYSHVLNSHCVWNNRIDPKQAAFGIWQIHSIRDFKSINEMNHKHSLLILDELDLNKTIHYSTSTGQPFSNDIRDLLFHVINHSTYHRGQIATEFRQSGLDPLATDFVLYKR